MDAVTMRIAAVMVNYDNVQLVERAIARAIRQSLPPSEIIIVDDEPTNPTLITLQRIATTCPIRLLQKPHGGRSSALNFAIANSCSEYIAFLDQGYEWYPTHLERLAKPLLNTCIHVLGWVYSDLDVIDSDGRMVGHSVLRTAGVKHQIRDVYTILSGRMLAPMSASLISRKAFEAVGRFDEELTDYEDEDLFLRMFRNGYENVFVDIPLLMFRACSDRPSYALRMSGSSMFYLKKLLRYFPDDQACGRFYARDFVVPRFFAQLFTEYVAALRSGQSDVALTALRSLGFVTQQHKLRIRLLMRPVLATLHCPFVARSLLIPMLLLLRPIVRRVMR